MSFLAQRSPIAVHFGALETRLLQLQAKGKTWTVRSAETFAAFGKNRHWQVSESIKSELKRMKLKGKDVAIGMSGEEVAVSLVPVEESNRSRLQEILQDSATTSIEDEEGVTYRYLPLSSTINAGRASEEFLLLTAGAAELRRCTDAVKGLDMRPVSLELSAFAIARSLGATRNSESDEPWGFLHLGFGHSLFGVVHEGEVRFLKPLQITGNRLMVTLQRVLDREGTPHNEADGPSLSDLLAGDAGDEADASEGSSNDSSEGSSHKGTDASAVASLNSAAVGHAVEVLHALRLEAESVAQEVRACTRHFSNRNRGAKVERVALCGFGATLPEVENAIAKALTIPVEQAKPFTEMGIRAPEELMDEEHMWSVALGLAMRGFE